MKKIAAALFITVIPWMQAFAAGNLYVEPRIGIMVPWGAGLGFRGGGLFGFNFDSVVSLNGNLDYFRTSYGDQVRTTTSDGIMVEGVDSEVMANLVILSVNCRVTMPFFQIAGLITPYAQAGLAYELMINTYRQNGVADTTYLLGDFGVPLEIGAQVKLGEKSALFVSLGYNICWVKRMNDDIEQLNVSQIINTGGFSVLSGIKFDL